MINRHVTPRGSGMKSVHFFRTGQCACLKVDDASLSEKRREASLLY